MKLPAQYGLPEELEQFLGDPDDPENPFSFAASVALDERDEYPEEACRRLDDWGMPEHYIPPEHGGKLTSYEQFLAMWRLISRRDMNIMLVHGKTWLGAVPVLILGNDKLKRRVVEIIRERGQLALGLSERHHGADLVSTGTAVRRVPEGFSLTGEKWLINLATRATGITVVAREDQDLSMFFVDKAACDPASYQHLPKVKTLGVRGADISGIRFEDTLLAEHALIGGPNKGLEVTVKTLQLTRSMMAGFALGPADTAIRAAMDFALHRRLYNDTVFAIPHARKTMAECFADLLACDCVAIAATRGLHAATEQMLIWHAISKYFVPVTTHAIIRSAGVVLGARYYLREDHWAGVFQKMERDNAIVSVFDGSTVVNLSWLGAQLRRLASTARQPPHVVRARLAAVFTLDQPVPPFDQGRLNLVSTGEEDVSQGVATALERVIALREGGQVDPTVIDVIVRFTRDLCAEVRRNERMLMVLEDTAEGEFERSNGLFVCAERFCVAFAAAACVNMWVHNRDALDPFFAGGSWLAVCLHRLLERLDPGRRTLPSAVVLAVADELERRTREGRLFSIVPLQLWSAARRQPAI